MKSGCALSHPYDNNYGHTVFNNSAMAPHSTWSPHTVLNCNSVVSSALQCIIHSLPLWCNGTAHGLHTESSTVTVVALLVQQPASLAEVTIFNCAAVAITKHVNFTTHWCAHLASGRSHIYSRLMYCKFTSFEYTTHTGHQGVLSLCKMTTITDT